MAEPSAPRAETHDAETHDVELATDPATALRRVAAVAELWDGAWQVDGSRGGRLGLPVVAGLRRGWVAGEVRVEPSSTGTRLRFEVDRGEYRLDRASVATLSIAAAGAVVLLFAPFFPALIRLVPVGLMLTVGAWLFIVARLRNSGPEEFFAELESEVSPDDAGAGIP